MSESMKDEASYPGAVPPPPGDIPDLGNPQDASRTLGLAVLIGCDILVTIFFTTRAYVKVRVTHEILLEDGYHAWEVTPEDYSQVLKTHAKITLKWLYANSIIYFPTAYFTKITLLLLIGRVFAVKRRVTKSIHIFIIVLLVAHLPVQIIKIAICIPIRAYWDPLVHGRCLNQRKIFIFGLSLAIFTDLVILLVPMPLTWSLRVPLRKKIKIMAMLGAGGIATGMTILRMYKAVKFIHSNDVTADFVSLTLTAMAELTIGLICSCFPAVNILIERRTTKPSRNSPCSNKKPLNMRQDQCDLPCLGTGPDEASHVKGSDISSLNFDVELAILSRYTGQMGRGEAGQSNHGHLFDERVNSMSPDRQRR
uniref:Rhodopsin domain-containing protein n=1 Tax=Bionectria ochroleuca TaxID=29856 RepID=A0A0B7KT88_BIOOC